MFKPLALFIGLRYTRSKYKNNFISFISLASMLGILFGVLVLITVLSVMNGFEKELRDRILSMVSHVTVSESSGLLNNWQQEQKKLAANEAVKGSAPFIEKQVMLSANGELRGVLLQGVLPEEQSKVGDVNKKVIEGDFSDLKPRSYEISLGVELAQSLGVFPGDKVTVITPQIRITPAGMIPRSRRFTVSSIYKINMAEYDAATAFIHMRDASKLFKTGDAVTGIRLKLDDLFKAPTISQELQEKFGTTYNVVDWGQENKSLFQVQKTEKVVMFFILFLIVLVAVFNLISSLVMVVNDKQSDIAILRTQGMSASHIRRIFMVQGTVIGLFGALLGAVLGIILANNIGEILAFFETLLKIDLLPQDLFYASDKFPSVINYGQVLGISIAAFVLAILATLYPASRAAKVQPAESLRYE